MLLNEHRVIPANIQHILLATLQLLLWLWLLLLHLHGLHHVLLQRRGLAALDHVDVLDRLQLNDVLPRHGAVLRHDPLALHRHAVLLLVVHHLLLLLHLRVEGLLDTGLRHRLDQAALLEHGRLRWNVRRVARLGLDELHCDGEINTGCR